MHLLFILLLSIYLGACSFATINESPTLGDVEDADFDPPLWMEENRAYVVDETVNYLRDKYPEVDGNFPHIKIDKVTFSNLNITEPYKSVEGEFRSIMQQVSNHFIKEESSVPIWHVELDIRYYQPGERSLQNTIAGISLVPRAILCFQTLFVLCPDASQSLVEMEITVTQPSGAINKLISTGSSTAYTTSVVIYDNSDVTENGLLKLHTYAFVAATADGVDQLVSLYKINKSSFTN